jgi:hypothetical protein
MAFSVKDWRNLLAGGTPINAASLEDMEQRLSEYTDLMLGGVSGGTSYKGTWNASTNTPTLVNGTGTGGDMYAVSVGASHDFGAGSITFAAGDYAIYNGTIWQKIATGNVVTSVAGKTGAVTLVKGDAGLANADNTSDAAKPVSTAQQTALDALAAAARVIPRISLNSASRAAGGWVLSDFGKGFDSASTAARSVAIPQISTLNAPEGSYFFVRRSNTGALTVQGEIAGMIANPTTGTLVDSVTLPNRYSVAMFVKWVGTLDVWTPSGDFA